MAFHSGDINANAIVADIGGYSSKLGFAGEDYPKSYFRSNVAFLRKDEMDTGETTKKPRRQEIEKISSDFYSRPLNSKQKSDDGWEVGNAVDYAGTGLWYNGHDEYADNSGADWNDLLVKSIQHGYSTALGTVTENFPLMLVERSYNPPPIRQQVIQTLFEELNVPAAFLARDATLACYATGRTTGTVVDIGYGGTVVTPVYEGYVETKGVRRSCMGGLEMDKHVLRTLDRLTKKTEVVPLYQVRGFKKRGGAIHSLSRLDIARQAKEMGAGASIATNAGDSAKFNAPHVAFKLPDGETVHVPSKDRFSVPDLLFSTEEQNVQHREAATAEMKKIMSSYISESSHHDDEENDDNKDKDKKDEFTESAAVGISTRRNKKTRKQQAKQQQQEKQNEEKEEADAAFPNKTLMKACTPYLQTQLEYLTASAIPDMVCDSAFRCDRDQQPMLLGNVVLCGGGACMGPTDQAMPDLLRERVESIIHTHTPGWRVKVLSPSVQERSVCSWLGGSILGSLGTFHDMWITKAEYDEWGTAIVNRKCP